MLRFLKRKMRRGVWCRGRGWREIFGPWRRSRPKKERKEILVRWKRYDDMMTVLQYFGWPGTALWWWSTSKNHQLTWIWSQRCYVVQLRRRGVLSPTGTNIDIKLSFYFQNHWTETIIVLLIAFIMNHQHHQTRWLKPSSSPFSFSSS